MSDPARQQKFIEDAEGRYHGIWSRALHVGGRARAQQVSEIALRCIMAELLAASAHIDGQSFGYLEKALRKALDGVELYANSAGPQ
jgi:hypothetical protein